VSRTFAYCRVSTADQTTENQIREIEGAGFKVEPHRIVEETVSGSSAIEQRPGFLKLMDRLERGDCFVVTKLDRLGRNAIDILSTVARLEANGVRVHCLALGGVDLTSAAGKMMMTVVAAMAAFEKDLLIERTQAGLERAWAAGKVSGRRAILTDDQRADVRAKLAGGASVSALAREMGISRMTVMRSRGGAAA
jgi:putative DNA-invertase from lambdoid prophage Rac